MDRFEKTCLLLAGIFALSVAAGVFLRRLSGPAPPPPADAAPPAVPAATPAAPAPQPFSRKTPSPARFVGQKAAPIPEPPTGPPAGSASVRGIVVYAETGRPAARVEVLVLRLGAAVETLARDRTDADGAFRFDRLPEGSAVRVVAREDGWADAVSAPLALEAGATAEAATLLLERGTPCDGTVADGEGRPVAGALVSAYRVVDTGPQTQSSFPQAMTMTDETGAFRFDALAEGRYNFRAEKDGYRPSALLNYRFEPGESPAIRLVLGR